MVLSFYKESNSGISCLGYFTNAVAGLQVGLDDLRNVTAALMLSAMMDTHCGLRSGGHYQQQRAAGREKDGVVLDILEKTAHEKTSGEKTKPGGKTRRIGKAK